MAIPIPKYDKIKSALFLIDFFSYHTNNMTIFMADKYGEYAFRERIEEAEYQLTEALKNLEITMNELYQFLEAVDGIPEDSEELIKQHLLKL